MAKRSRLDLADVAQSPQIDSALPLNPQACTQPLGQDACISARRLDGPDQIPNVPQQRKTDAAGIT
jgi:hypothetical protein